MFSTVCKRCTAFTSIPTLDVGRYGLRTGPVTAASDRFDVYVRQEGTGHSARPHESADTVWIANQIMNQYYQLAGRITDARNPAVLTICKMAGGEAHNVIPETTQFGGTLRSVNQADRQTIRTNMRRIAQQFGNMYDASVELDFEDGAPPVINDQDAVQNVAVSVGKMFGEQAIFNIPETSMGGEDFAYYLQELPGAFVRVGTSSSDKTSFPLHHHHFDIDERPLAPTARLMATVLINHLNDETLLNKAQPFQRDGYDWDGKSLTDEHSNPDSHRLLFDANTAAHGANESTNGRGDT